ncbi:MAG: acetylxylan esterase [Bacteroidales bacterium]|nr:acetylxylan esterase [Bacteroidales bacterium]
MKPIRIFAVLAVASAVLLSSCRQSSPSFVKVEDGVFVCEDYPSHFIGTNFWYGAILGSEGQGGDRARLEAELDTLKALGMTNLRVLVGGDGPDGIPTRVCPTLQKEPGVYNDTIFRGLDYLLAEMAERNMKAVLYINNSWEWSGGYGMYLEWAGAGKALIPAEVGYKAYCDYVSQFVTNEKAKNMFYDHVRHVVSRTNTVTGKPYKDDPAIFSWQIGNEPRCFRPDSAGQAAFVDFMWTTASLIKSIDPNHMVSSGSEGRHGCEGSLELFEKVHSCPDIDYMNIHIWPYNWSWVRENTLKTNLPIAIKNTDEYIDEHLAIAEKYGKPVVMEEFGFPRDDFKFAQGTPTTSRDRYYMHVFGRIAESAKEKGLFAGLNFWGWGGLASQSQTNIYWQQGDDYCGDPAQEQQGLNSVYACDQSTLKVIRYAASAIEKALGPQAWFEVEENDGIFIGEGPHVLEVGVKAPEDGKMNLVLEVETDKGEPVGTYDASVKVRDGKAAAGFSLDLVPGFYKAVLYLSCEEGKTELCRSNVGFNPEQIASPQDKQPDFDEFWEQTLSELAAVDPEYKLTLLPEHSNDIRRVYHVEMRSWGGEKISGVYAEPVKEGKYNTTIYYMGYNSDVYYPDPSANPDMIEFTLCVRGQALNTPATGKGIWVAEGLESKDTYYYRGAFADVVRAVDFVCSREKVDQDHLVAEGESQGGAFSFISASLDHRIKAIAPAVPFLGDYPDYFKVASWPGNEVIAAQKELGISDEDLYRTLSYFDVKNFTDRIECPVYMSIGLQDPTCPPHTNFASYNHVKSEKQWICYPHCGHAMWQVPEWREIKKEFFARFRK